MRQVGSVLGNAVRNIIKREGTVNDPKYWFNLFSFADVSGISQMLKDAIASFKVIGFAVALASTVAYIAGYIIAWTPQKREVYKSRVLTLYLLTVILFGGLAIADVLYDVARSMGGV